DAPAPDVAGAARTLDRSPGVGRVRQSGAMPDPALSALPRLLATDDAVVAVASGRADVVAVPDAARPLFAAAVHELAGIRPVLVAVPTVAEAERIAGDLVPMLGRGAVELFPAWETLPFE